MQQQVLPLEFSHLRGGFLEQGLFRWQQTP
jgi:hypothetical protein